MATQIEVDYFEERDILSIQFLPRRPARMGETSHHFFIRYDWDHPDQVVGFEIMDFSLFVPRLREPGAVPAIDMRFEVEGTSLAQATLREVLEWAYRRFVLQALPFSSKRDSMARAAVR